MNIDNYDPKFTAYEEFGTEHIRLDPSAIDRVYEDTDIADYLTQASYKRTITEGEADALTSWLSELSSALYIVYDLLYLQGLNQEQAALVLGTSQSVLSHKSRRLTKVLKALNYPRQSWHNLNRTRHKTLTAKQKYILKDLRAHYNYTTIAKRYNEAHNTKMLSQTVTTTIDRAIEALSNHPEHQAEIQYIRDNPCILSGDPIGKNV